jgi:hypothetical protein
MTETKSRMGALIALTDHLVRLMTRENELIESRRPGEIQATLEEKSRLANTYNAELKALKANPSLLNNAPPTELLAFKEATRRFREVVELNRMKLTAVRNVTEGLLQAIGNELAKNNKAVNRYDEKARMGPVASNWDVAHPTSLAVNQVI